MSIINRKAANIALTSLCAAGALVVGSAGFAADNNTAQTQSQDKPKLDVMQMRAQYANRVPGFIQVAQPPSGFPVPAYTGQVMSANYVVSRNSPAMSGTIVTHDPAETAYLWYKQVLVGANWTWKTQPQSTAEKAGKLLLLNAARNDVALTISFVKTGKADLTIINITSMVFKTAK